MVDPSRSHLLPVKKVKEIHDNQERQEVQVDLSKKSARHVLMPFWTFGNICLVESILSRVKTLVGGFVELDLFRRRLRHHVQLTTVARVPLVYLQAIHLGPGSFYLYDATVLRVETDRADKKASLRGRRCNSECAKHPRGEQKTKQASNSNGHEPRKTASADRAPLTPKERGVWCEIGIAHPERFEGSLPTVPS